jgi:transcriptional regulator with XRE-family HTH domain
VTWTGQEIRRLRHAKNMSMQEFANHLGVSKRMVAKWEAGGRDIKPGEFYQECLTVCLERSSAEERSRFLGRSVLYSAHPIWTNPEMKTALAERNIAAVYKKLQNHGIPQRKIAALTDQSQSEVSEILKGRRVNSYDVLVRICEGLGIPRSLMGLSYEQEC